MNGSGSKQRTLWIVFGLTLFFLVVELVVGIISNSLALLADAVHMFTDALALALAAFAAWIAQKPVNNERTFGYYRVEILAALANGVILTGSSIFIIYEAYQRILAPRELTAIPVIITAVIGLLVNLAGVWMLNKDSQSDLNVRGAFFEVVKDALGSVAVIVAAIVIYFTEFYLIDPIVSVLIAVFILPRTWNLLRESVDILLEATPKEIDIEKIKNEIIKLDLVDTIHDMHVWTITTGFFALSGHVVLTEKTNVQEASKILKRINTILDEQFNIQHSTIQLEFEDIQTEEPNI